MKITYSSELISNFKQAEVVSPEKQFQALQTDDGCSLLFSISTDGTFYVTDETSDHVTGWERTPLSDEVMKAHAGGRIKTFAAAQNRKSGEIDLAMVVATADTDHVYLSLGNSGKDASWAHQPKWQLARSVPAIKVAGVFISEATDGEYIVVDVSRNPTDTLQFVRRYYLDTDPKKLANGEAWKLHEMAVDLDITAYASCLGRQESDRVDGIYTLGRIGRHDSLTYQQLYSPFNPDEPTTVARLYVPEGSSPSAIAAAVMTDSHETDLYVACDRALYRFPYDGQDDGAEGVKVMDHPLFNGVTRLFAFATDTSVVVWGLNRAQQIFYTRCDRTRLDSPDAWLYPVPILDEVEQVSPYVNRAADGQLFFAHTGNNQFKKATQSLTSTWKFEPVLLKPLTTKAKATKFPSYVTRIQVTDDQNRPLGNLPHQSGTPSVTVKLAAIDRVGIYVNNRYYVLTPEPISIPVDATGGLMVVEWVDALEATELQVHRDAGDPVRISPMDKPLQRAAQLDSDDKLVGASVPKADGTPDKPLLPPATSTDVRKRFVASVQQLGRAHQSLSGGPKPSALRLERERSFHELVTAPETNVMSFAVSADGVSAVARAHLEAVAATAEPTHSLWGDFIQWLKSAFDYVVHFIEDTVNKVWHFVVEIAGKIFRFVLDAAAKIAGAFQALFNWIKTAIEDVVKYLSFLFAWHDIQRTRDVFKKLITLSALQMADEIDGLKVTFDAALKQVTDRIDDWAGIDHLDKWTNGPGIDQPASHHMAQADTEHAHSAPAAFMADHFNSNSHNSEFTSAPSGGGPGDELLNLIKSAFQAVEAEGEVLQRLVARFKSEVIDKFDSLPIGDVLKHVVAVVLDALVETVRVLGDLVFKVMAALIRGIIKLLDEPIRIPVLSDILEDVFGIAPFSVLDVLCLIGAVPATIVYKIARNAAPFPVGDSFSDRVLQARSIAELRESFQPAPAHHRLLAAAADGAPHLLRGDDKTNATPISLDHETQRRLFTSGHVVSGIIGLLVLPGLAAADVIKEETFLDASNPVSLWASIAAVLAAGPGVYARIFADPHPIKSVEIATLSSIAGGSTFVAKVVHGGVGMYFSRFKGDRISEMMVTKIGSFWDCVFAVVGFVPTCYHFYELSQQEVSDGRSAAIIQETANICTLVARLLEFGARMDNEMASKVIASAVMGGFYAANGVLQLGEAYVGGRS